MGRGGGASAANFRDGGNNDVTLHC
jgi:hypothetical protein